MCLVSFEEAFDFTLFYDVSAEYLFQQKFIRTWEEIFSRSQEFSRRDRIISFILDMEYFKACI